MTFIDAMSDVGGSGVVVVVASVCEDDDVLFRGWLPCLDSLGAKY